jgi:hypothetical protein
MAADTRRILLRGVRHVRSGDRVDGRIDIIDTERQRISLVAV